MGSKKFVERYRPLVLVFSAVALLAAGVLSELLEIGLGATVLLISSSVLVLARQSVAFGIRVSAVALASADSGLLPQVQDALLQEAIAVAAVLSAL
ncbi:exported hypothetical protein [Rhizobium mesoamericanum STM3625]|uniref:Uncharacterized protein n=1 Tax=Rhizobium mesoamericanum STM3625 TaxID=1211777 RepID=K0PQN8_9HYPH|nr:exported hypothetical protein [Rhizobium mesoamericanum STM3625]